MKTLITIAALAIAASCAHGKGCGTKDKWTGDDKTAHLGIGAAAGLAGSLMNDGSFMHGMKWAAIGAVGKEALDAATGTGTCSAQDLLVTLAGGAIGSSLGVGLSIMRDKTPEGAVRTTLWFNREF